jgi:hypothetical protein
MRLILTSVFCLAAVFAIAAPLPQGGGGAPKNLKVLTPDDMRAGAMQQARQGLGVNCNYCHVQDRSSDENPKKLIARNMFQMTKDINAKFPDGKVHVTCYTCHRGAAAPLTAPPAAEEKKGL